MGILFERVWKILAVASVAIVLTAGCASPSYTETEMASEQPQPALAVPLSDPAGGVPAPINLETQVAAEQTPGSRLRNGYYLQKVFFATDRNEVSSTPQLFGAEQAQSVTYGACWVSIPAGHRVGDIETPTIWRLQVRPDPKKHIVLMRTQKVASSNYFSDVSTVVASSPRRDAFVFVHGYNVTFDDAARRTAQMAYDLHFNGAPIFYSWPSQGKFVPYVADEENAERTQHNLQQFLLDIADKTRAENIYLIAHSMGNRPLTRALSEITKTGRKMKGQFKELILAAADLDADVFKQDIVPFLADAAEGITLYVSDKDKALIGSQKMHHYSRAGQTGNLVLVKGIDTIDASQVDTDFLGHSYFVEKPVLLEDMFYIITDHFRADRRAGLHPMRSPGAQTYWQFDRQ